MYNIRTFSVSILEFQYLHTDQTAIMIVIINQSTFIYAAKCMVGPEWFISTSRHKTKKQELKGKTPYDLRKWTEKQDLNVTLTRF